MHATDTPTAASRDWVLISTASARHQAGANRRKRPCGAEHDARARPALMILLYGGGRALRQRLDACACSMPARSSGTSSGACDAGSAMHIIARARGLTWTGYGEGPLTRTPTSLAYLGHTGRSTPYLGGCGNDGGDGKDHRSHSQRRAHHGQRRRSCWHGGVARD